MRIDTNDIELTVETADMSEHVSPGQLDLLLGAGLWRCPLNDWWIKHIGKNTMAWMSRRADGDWSLRIQRQLMSSLPDEHRLNQKLIFFFVRRVCGYFGLEDNLSWLDEKGPAFLKETERLEEAAKRVAHLNEIEWEFPDCETDQGSLYRWSPTDPDNPTPLVDRDFWMLVAEDKWIRFIDPSTVITLDSTCANSACVGASRLLPGGEKELHMPSRSFQGGRAEAIAWLDGILPELQDSFRSMALEVR